MRSRILFVEDEESLQRLLGDRLHAEGYAVEHALDAESALKRITSAAFDLIILDIMLPGMDGFELCHRIRAVGMATPILMLTARGRTEDKVNGLRIGADDYVTKPFEVRELLARIEVLLRRTPVSLAHSAIFQFGALRIDVPATEVTLNGAPLNLSAREFQLLRYLVEHRGKTLSREELLQEVWDYSADAYTRTVDVHIASLRNKLRGDDDHSGRIQTVKGIGYKFTP
jgi:two-component system, OmpR family, alkaline phosphatase synthesis response regulator PhoP